MIKSSYYDYIYKVNGETIKLKPERIFEPKSVYLIVDKDMKLIWIWAGSQSRLFHRYMAANWAGKLKTKKKFYNFKYEVIKQGIEPTDFHTIFNEIKENRRDLEYPGQSRNALSSSFQNFGSSYSTDQMITQNISSSSLSTSIKSHIRKLLSEIKEIQMHVKYSMDHISQRFTEIEKLLEK